MLVQLAVLKRALGITGSGSDAALEEAEVRAAMFVERMTGRRFGQPAPRTEYFPGHNGDTFWLSGRIAAPSSATVALSERCTGLGTWETIPTASYEVREAALVRLDGFAFMRGYEYRVTYPDGLTAVPGDIQELVIELVEGMNDRASGASGIQSESIGDYSYTLAAESIISAGSLTENGRAILNRYRALHA